MRFSLFLSLTLFLFSVIVISCSKDEADEIREPEFKNETYKLDVPHYFGNYDATIEQQLTKGGVELGRMLFYEKKLSGDNTMSCASCHKQEKAFSDGNIFSKGIQGIEGSKNSMSLSNLIYSNFFFWDGRSMSLDNQALIPIQDPLELHQSLDEAVAKLQNTDIYPAKFKFAFGTDTITADLIAKALMQFEATLISSNSKFDQYMKGIYNPTEQELRGIQLFRTHPVEGVVRGGNCGDCHLGNLFNGDQRETFGFHNNGLDDEATLDEGLMNVTKNPGDKGKFKTPSLRNIALSAPYMHDGRFKTLEEVLDHYNEGIKKSRTLDPLISSASNGAHGHGEDDPILLQLTEQEKKDIIVFLHMLTDEEFTKDPKFSDPFKE